LDLGLVETRSIIFTNSHLQQAEQQKNINV